MKNKTISIPDKLFQQLTTIDNASNLITTLLEQHLNKPKDKVIDNPNLFDIMDKSEMIINKELVNERLRDAILKEIEEQNKIDLLNNIFIDNENTKE